ncbi:hypothetical protein IV203_031584 [Nitzschia inconspicua]|uniref:Uncharacterized protein n=1 Tax=Nitzschia inconspicua TaxID=303405 RepID=A0A9K3KQR3_9STRA|nr:hypothetical protein IV203_016872 [Nitzschia inconspicua]KAG7368841.1 hypothetical protein IV203_031584 [Nitzschia inconspicua]
MKFSLLALLAVVATANAGRPQLSISVRDGTFDGLDGLDPTLTWEGSANSGDLTLDYGIQAAARPTTDIASLPRNIWGKASTNVAGWGVSARAERDMSSDDTALEFDASNDDADLNIRVVASAGGGVERVEATKGMNMNGARVTLNPRYNVGTEEADVVVGWDNGDTNVKLTASADSQEVNVKHRMDNTNIELNASQDSQSVTIDHQMDNTNIKLTASADNQEVTVSQQLDANNRISPTINNNGDISVEWQRSLGDDSSLTATLKPNESLNVEWKDNDWTANVDMGLSGTDITGANVHVKRDVSF